MTLGPVPLPLLITGVSGVAGYNALPYFRQRYPGHVVAIRQRDNWRLQGPGIEPCDAEDYDALSRLFDRYGFRSVLDCAGNCALKSCELDPAMAWRINVEGPRNLLHVLRGRGARLVHLSIDLVFGGRAGHDHREDDPCDAVTVYGKTMRAGEELVGAADPGACILRISLPMGVSFNGHAGAIDWIQSRFKNGRPATLYHDEVRTPTYTDCLNEVFEDVLARDLSGVYHAGGPRKLTLYQIAQVVNRVGGYDPRCLRGLLRAEAGPVPPRAGDVSLDSRALARALGYEPFDPWPADEAHVPTDPEWHHRRGGSEPGSPRLLAARLYRNPRRATPAAERAGIVRTAPACL